MRRWGRGEAEFVAGPDRRGDGANRQCRDGIEHGEDVAAEGGAETCSVALCALSQVAERASQTDAIRTEQRNHVRFWVVRSLHPGALNGVGGDVNEHGLLGWGACSQHDATQIMHVGAGEGTILRDFFWCFSPCAPRAQGSGLEVSKRTVARVVNELALTDGVRLLPNGQE